MSEEKREWLYYDAERDRIILVDSKPYMVYVKYYETDEEIWHTGAPYKAKHDLYYYENEDGHIVPFGSDYVPSDAVVKNGESVFGWIRKDYYSSYSSITIERLEKSKSVDGSILDDTVLFRVKNGELVNIFDSSKKYSKEID